MGLDCDPISGSEWQTHCPQWQVLPHNNSIVASSLFPFIPPVGTKLIRYLKSIFDFMPNPNVSPWQNNVTTSVVEVVAGPGTVALHSTLLDTKW